MAIVTVAFIDNAETFAEAPDGSMTISSKYLVTGLSGLGLEPSSVTYIATIQNGIPPHRSGHATGLPIQVLRRTARSLDGDTVEVTVEWGAPSPDDLSINDEPIRTFGSTLQQITTERDINGRPIIVQHAFALPAGLAGPPITKSQTAQITTQVPMATITFQERLTIDGATLLEQVSSVVGTTNSIAWPNGASVANSAPGTWLCTGRTGTSDDGGVNYNLTTEFQQAPKLATGSIQAFRIGTNNTLAQVTITNSTWEGFAIYIDESTGRPPSGRDVAFGGTGIDPIPTEVVRFTKSDFADALGLS